MKLLLEHGADPNLQDHLGRTPAHLVILYWPRIQLTAETTELSPEENQYQVDSLTLADPRGGDMGLILPNNRLAHPPMRLASPSGKSCTRHLLTPRLILRKTI